jgi:hypothetical protein
VLDASSRHDERDVATLGIGAAVLRDLALAAGVHDAVLHQAIGDELRQGGVRVLLRVPLEVRLVHAVNRDQQHVLGRRARDRRAGAALDADARLVPSKPATPTVSHRGVVVCLRPPGCDAVRRVRGRVVEGPAR